LIEIAFTQEEKNILVYKLKRYLDQELDFQLGQFDAEFLLDFFSKEIGVYHYNRGLKDAQDVIKTKVESMTDAIYELEMPTQFSGR